MTYSTPPGCSSSLAAAAGGRPPMRSRTICTKSFLPFTACSTIFSLSAQKLVREQSPADGRFNSAARCSRNWRRNSAGSGAGPGLAAGRKAARTAPAEQRPRSGSRAAVFRLRRRSGRCPPDRRAGTLCSLSPGMSGRLLFPFCDAISSMPAKTPQQISVPHAGPQHASGDAAAHQSPTPCIIICGTGAVPPPPQLGLVKRLKTSPQAVLPPVMLIGAVVAAEIFKLVSRPMLSLPEALPLVGIVYPEPAVNPRFELVEVAAMAISLAFVGVVEVTEAAVPEPAPPVAPLSNVVVQPAPKFISTATAAQFCDELIVPEHPVVLPPVAARTYPQYCRATLP